MPTIELVVGDWSGDGHEKTSSVHIKSNMKREELFAAIESKEVKDVFDIHQVCSDYEENKLSQGVYDKLMELGILKAIENDQDDFYVYTDVYVELLLDVVKHFYPTFKYSIVNNDSINIGGYGLFY